MATETIEPIELADAARERYLRYAMSVITARALPDVRDGLKPVQRRILYVMDRILNLRVGNRAMKSAQVVGRVMGAYHPHGDQAIYDAMVRMAQPFSLRYPLVDGQGNFGAITGDSAAAHRYTEARLVAFGSQLCSTIGEETVSTRPTYDGRNEEPEVLPVPAPLILLNGAAGIAVGMSTNIPPHNLDEIVKACTTLIDNPDASIAQVVRSIKGPDFPGAGPKHKAGEIVATREQIKAIYETGNGSIKVRATWKLEVVERTKRQRVDRRYLVMDSIPYGTNTGQILSKIKELLENKKLPGVQSAADQTTEEDGVRVVLELGADADEKILMGALYRMTPLEINYPVNLTCLIPTQQGSVPRPYRHVDIKTILAAWLDFRFDVVTRSIEYRKARLEDRIHILEGFLKVLGKINEAIKLVQSAKDKPDAEAKLRKRFKLSELQAKACVELQLYRLAQMELKKIKDERAEKQTEADRLGKLLKGPKPRWALIKKELVAFAKEHGDKRRTKILGEVDEELEFDPTALIKREDTHVILTREGRLKRVKKLEDPGKLRMRDQDELFAIVQGSTLASVVFFTNYGSAYVMGINDVPPTAGFGEPIQKFFNFSDGEQVVRCLSLDPRLLADPSVGIAAASALGYLVRAPLEPHLEPSTRSGRKFIRLGKGDEVVGVEVCEDSPKHILMLTNKGNGLRVPFKDVPEVQGVGKGRRGVKLPKKELLIGMTVGKALYVATNRGAQNKVLAKNVPMGEVGDVGENVSRVGFARVIPAAPVLYELPEEQE